MKRSLVCSYIIVGDHYKENNYYTNFNISVSGELVLSPYLNNLIKLLVRHMHFNRRKTSRNFDPVES